MKTKLKVHFKASQKLSHYSLRSSHGRLMRRRIGLVEPWAGVADAGAWVEEPRGGGETGKIVFCNNP